MHATDERRDRTMSRLADLAEDAAVIVMLVSFLALVAAVIVAAVVV